MATKEERLAASEERNRWLKLEIGAEKLLKAIKARNSNGTSFAYEALEQLIAQVRDSDDGGEGRADDGK